jgi:IrrE N-terminal-like domain
MTLQVPYLAYEAIERDAEALLAQYAHAKGVEIRAPIPIEDIVEKHLKLRMEFDDLRRLFGLPGGRKPDIFGAIWLDSARIVIDESLDPEEHPLKEERYRFTLAHEGGHWRLHRLLVTQRSIVVCRSSQANERVELQANLYASCLLMPRKLVMEAWRDKFGNDHPYLLRRKSFFGLPYDMDPKLAGILRSFEQSDLYNFALPLAEKFRVSPTSMRIRLEKLGLIRREVPRPESLLARA